MAVHCSSRPYRAAFPRRLSSLGRRPLAVRRVWTTRRGIVVSPRPCCVWSPRFPARYDRDANTRCELGTCTVARLSPRASNQQPTHSALFVDFDNVYIGLRNLDLRAAERFAADPRPWLAWIEEGMPGREDPRLGDLGDRLVLIRRCYLNPVAFAAHRPVFTRAGFSVIDCPPLTAQGKTSTDIHMVMDILDTLRDYEHISEYIVLSGDADFTPVLLRLRARDRRTVVLPVGPAAAAFRASADRVLAENDFVDIGLGERTPVGKEDESVATELNSRANRLIRLDRLRLRIAAAVLGGVDVKAADDLLGARPEHGEREAGALGEVAHVPFQVAPVGVERHALDRRPAPRREAGRRADVRDARRPRRVVRLVVLRAERHEVELGHLQLPRRVEVVGHERPSAHGP